jgi:uncharacterized membrane protein YoaK (UPF0700 family)
MEERHGDRHLLAALLALTFVTGIVDAVSYLGLGHVFTANMTGNVVLLGFAVAGASGFSAPRSLLSLLAFLVGAVCAGRLSVLTLNTPRRRWLVTAGSVEAGLLLGAGVVSIGAGATTDAPSHAVYAVIALTGVAMGFRTMAVRLLAVPDVTTTVLTQTLAAVAGESWLAGGRNPWIGRRVAAVVLMFTGAAVGMLLLRYGPAVPLIVSAACVLGTSLYAGSVSQADGGETGRRTLGRDG